MEIIDFFYDEVSQILTVIFTTDPDSDLTRTSHITLNDIKLYSTLSVDEEDVIECDEDFIIEILEEYFYDHELPEEGLF
jgi:hypothetical protein